LRKTGLFLSQFESISHESVRVYYHKIKEVLNEPKKTVRNLIAIDETKLKGFDNLTVSAYSLKVLGIIDLVIFIKQMHLERLKYYSFIKSEIVITFYGVRLLKR